MEKSQLLVRQTSKVEKIPDDEHEGLLQQKSSDELPNEHHCPQHTETTNIKENSPVSNALVRALSQTDETVDENTKRQTRNGDVLIPIPSTNTNASISNSGCCNNGCCREVNLENYETLKKQKGIYLFLKSKCSKQTLLNIVFGILIMSALFIGIRALFKDTEGEHSKRYLYCYHCQNIGTIRNKIHVKDMCCTEDPIAEFPSPKTGAVTLAGDKPDVGSAKYNGTRILEFQADFFKEWKHMNRKDIIPWRDVTSIENSFARFENGQNTIKLLKDGNYAIMLSLTTDTYHGTQNSFRANACIVFDLPGGRTQEECKLITHSENMMVPFEIFKFDYLKNGTGIHAYITTSASLDRKSTHNKLYTVLLT